MRSGHTILALLSKGDWIPVSRPWCQQLWLRRGHLHRSPASPGKGLSNHSSAVDDAEIVDRVGLKPLLVLHGENDTRNPVDVAKDLYNRASEPKEMVIYPGAGANLVECKDEVREKLGMWVSEQLGESSAYLAALDAHNDECPDIIKPISQEDSDLTRHLVLTRDDMVDMEVDAMVSTTGSWLDLKHNPLSGDIIERGGWQIQEQLWTQAPLFIGDVGVSIHMFALGPPAHENEVVSAALAPPSDMVRRSSKTGCAEPALEGPLCAC